MASKHLDRQAQIDMIKTHCCWPKNWSTKIPAKEYNLFLSNHETCKTSGKCLFTKSSVLLKKYCQPELYGSHIIETSGSDSDDGKISPVKPKTGQSFQNQKVSDLEDLMQDKFKKFTEKLNDLQEQLTEKDNIIKNLEEKVKEPVFPAADIRERQKSSELQAKLDQMQQDFEKLQTKFRESNPKKSKHSRTITDSFLEHTEIISSGDESDDDAIPINLDIHKYVEAQDRTRNPNKPGVHLQKVLEKLDDAIPKHWTERLGSAYEFLINSYHRNCMRKRLSVAETAYFVHNFFGANVSSRIELIVKNKMKQYIENERACVEAEQLGHRPAKAHADGRLTERALKNDLYPAIAMHVQQKTVALSTPSWHRSEGDTVTDWFKVCLDYEKISRNTISKATSYEEKVAAVERMMSKLRDDNMPKLADAIKADPDIHVMMNGGSYEAKHRLDLPDLRKRLTRVYDKYQAETEVEKANMASSETCNIVSESTLYSYRQGNQQPRFNNSYQQNRSNNNSRRFQYKPKSNPNFNGRQLRYNDRNRLRNFENRTIQRKMPQWAKLFMTAMQKVCNSLNEAVALTIEDFSKCNMTFYEVNHAESEESGFFSDTEERLDYIEQEEWCDFINNDDVYGEYVLYIPRPPTAPRLLVLDFYINGSTAAKKTVRVIIDSGSTVEIFPKSLVHDHGIDKWIETNPDKEIQIKGFNNRVSKTNQYIYIKGKLGRTPMNVKFAVIDDSAEKIPHAIFGRSTLERMGLWEVMVAHIRQRYGIVASFECDSDKNNLEQNFSKNFSNFCQPALEPDAKTSRKPVSIKETECNSLKSSGSSISKLIVNKVSHFSGNKFNRINRDYISKRTLRLVSEFCKNSTFDIHDTELLSLKSSHSSLIKNNHFEAKNDPENTYAKDIQNFMHLLKLSPDDKINLLLVKTAFQIQRDYREMSIPDIHKHIVNNIGTIASHINMFSEKSTDVATALSCERKVINPHSYLEIPIDIQSPKQGVYNIASSKVKNLDVYPRLVDTSNGSKNLLFVQNTTGSPVVIRKGVAVATGNITTMENLWSKLEDDIRPAKEPILCSNPENSESIDVNDWSKVIAKLGLKELYQTINRLESFYNAPLVNNVERVGVNVQSCKNLFQCNGIVHENIDEYYESITATIPTEHSFQTDLDKAVDSSKTDEKVAEFKEKRKKEFDAKMKTLHPILQEPLIKAYDRFSGDAPGQWSLIRIKPIALPIQASIPSVVHPQYRKKYTQLEQDAIDDFVITGLARGTLERSDSNYLMPLVVAKKPPAQDGTPRGFRICGDMRQLNSKIFAFDSTPIPEIQEIILKVGDARMFSCWDSEMAYGHNLLEESSRPFVAFRVEDGLTKGIYQHRTLPFGNKASVGIFSRIMDYILKGLSKHGIFNFLDDTITASGRPGMSDEEVLRQHAEHISILMGRFRTFNVKLSISKSEIGQSHINYLGWVIGQSKLTPNEKTRRKVSEIKNLFVIDGSDKLWMQINGFFLFSAKLIPEFSSDRVKIKKLRAEYAAAGGKIDSAKKIESWKDKPKKPNSAPKTRKTDAELIKLKESLQSKLDKIFDKWSSCILEKQLHIPPKNSTLVLSTDSSGYAIGYTLHTLDGQLVEFGGRQLSDTETRYDIIDKELLATVFGLSRTKLHLSRAKITKVKIDNSTAKCYIDKQTECPQRALKFVRQIQLFDKVVFEKVDSDKNASDLASRMQWSNFSQCARIPRVTPAIDLDTTDRRSVCHFEDCFEDKPESNYLDVTELAILQDLSCSALGSDVSELIKKFHVELNHCGAFKLYRILRLQVPNLKITHAKIKAVLAVCPTCCLNKREAPGTTLTRRIIPDRPLKLVAIDHFSYSKVDNDENFTSILTIKDEMSRFVVAFPTLGYGHFEVTNYLSIYTQCFGHIEILLADNAFSSKTLDIWSKNNDTEVIHSPVWNPQSNAVVERDHRTFRRVFPLIQERLDIPDSCWHEVLPIATNYINNTPHHTTDIEPSMLMRGTLSSSYFSNQKELDDIKKLWSQAVENTRKAVKKRQHINNRDKIGINKLLKPGTEVFIFLGPKMQKYKATIIHDNGITCCVKKSGVNKRFSVITVHKRHISVIPGQD